MIIMKNIPLTLFIFDELYATGDELILLTPGLQKMIFPEFLALQSQEIQDKASLILRG